MARSYTAEDITGATRRLDVAMTSLTVALCRAVGISVPEMITLEHLDHEGTIGPSELARRLQMTTGAVTAPLKPVDEGGHGAGCHLQATGQLAGADGALVIEVLESDHLGDTD